MFVAFSNELPSLVTYYHKDFNAFYNAVTLIGNILP